MHKEISRLLVKYKMSFHFRSFIFMQFHSLFIFGKHFSEQKCSPVGCVPSAAVAVSWGAGGCLPSLSRGCLPEGYVCRGVSARGGCLPEGCVCLVCLGGVSARGRCLPGSVSPGGICLVCWGGGVWQTVLRMVITVPHWESWICHWRHILEV